VTSTSETLTIVFQSDASIAHEGFSVTYVTFDASQGMEFLSLFFDFCF
jgi:hypothetical protein